MANRWGNNGNNDRFYFLGSNITVDSDWKKRFLLLGRKALIKLDQHFKKQRHHFADKRLSCESYGSSSSHVWSWQLVKKEGWASKNWWFQTAVLEKTLETPLDNKEIKPVHPKGNQPWIFIGGTDFEREAPILWPPAVKSRPIGKEPDAQKNWRQ